MYCVDVILDIGRRERRALRIVCRIRGTKIILNSVAAVADQEKRRVEMLHAHKSARQSDKGSLLLQLLHTRKTVLPLIRIDATSSAIVRGGEQHARLINSVVSICNEGQCVVTLDAWSQGTVFEVLDDSILLGKE